MYAASTTSPSTARTMLLCNRLATVETPWADVGGVVSTVAALPIRNISFREILETKSPLPAHGFRQPDNRPRIRIVLAAHGIYSRVCYTLAAAPSYPPARSKTTGGYMPLHSRRLRRTSRP